MIENSRVNRRLIVAVDGSGYGAQHQTQQEDTQRALLHTLDLAAFHAGLDRSAWESQPGGDGQLCVLPPGVPEELVVDDFVRELDTALIQHNERLRQAYRLRLRLAVHYGVASPCVNGYAGPGPVLASRLASAEQASRVLRVAAQVDLVVVLSDQVYEDTVRQRRTSLRIDQFRRIAVQIKETDTHAWLHVPGLDVNAISLDETEPTTWQPRGPRRAAVTRRACRIGFRLVGSLHLTRAE